MDAMEEKLSAMLNNPQLMQQVMSMAQSLGSTQPQSSSPPSQENQRTLPELDLSMIKNISSLAGQGTIDKEQKALLSALGPYLSSQRVQKLEKAMRAAKMARLASAFLGQGGLQALTGR